MTSTFLDVQGRIGVSVHLGGLPMTRTLLALCHVEAAREILEVGCGIGVGPVHAARTHGCRVVGIDRSAAMLEWARRRAREAGVAERVELAVADVLELPFADDRFDAVVCESVLAFVPDKARAIAEMVRVARPGGHVGLNEAFLRATATNPRTLELARGLGTDMVTLEAWQALWDASGLEERVVRTYRIDPAREVRDRIRWIGLPWMLRAWARVLRLYATEPSLRQSIQTVFGAMKTEPTDEPGAPPPWASFGYGLFVGRKPQGDMAAGVA